MLSNFVTKGFPTVMTKQQAKRQKYFVFKYNELLKFEDLDRFDIPDGIKAMMKDWDVINKSALSDSFYSSEDIDWSKKPEGSYRVSDHWNFTSKRDNKERKHCRTDKPVPVTTHITIARFENGIYRVILTEPSPKYMEATKKMTERRAYMKSPEVIAMKREFKERVQNGEVYITFTKGKTEYRGRVRKYTGHELKIEDVSTSEIIFNDNNFTKGNKRLEMYNLKGEEIKDLF